MKIHTDRKGRFDTCRCPHCRGDRRFAHRTIRTRGRRADAAAIREDD